MINIMAKLAMNNDEAKVEGSNACNCYSEINNTSFRSKRIHLMLWSLREIFKRNYSLKFERGERNYE